MKQLLILSGKGGTGKTTVATALIQLAAAVACADCDVDAPNLHLLMNRGDFPQAEDFYGLDKAAIDTTRCVACGICASRCRFEAIESTPVYRVNNFACEGCGVCVHVCPTHAVTMTPAKAGNLMTYHQQPVFATARLKMGSGNSGMLVTAVKKRMKESVEKESFHQSSEALAVIDGSPGIGCPVIASITGVDLVLVVAEPSLSGISDLKRVVETARGLNTHLSVCINQWNISPENTNIIEEWCILQCIPVLGRIPYDPEVVTAINDGKSIVEVSCAAGEAVALIYEKLVRHLNQLEATGNERNM
ncbi:4Fe-4S binding protein [Anoxynatronum buryatiense]|uniref:MinD superfamily P-loop ATPase, contains an inserted ferredoxin domain n=1 Tax=Anoxynatronum buryatiense TaxID=489973 RepID=A0AA45WTJ3_9CLOT|nr:4Fe-4S binding protein [Anoxynatronum buryatiense]SMP43378.1 MinD superfamily P-loop ATPase, contains an inserted ferredoxin domain [Anoxynatronum buryatiense]